VPAGIKWEFHCITAGIDPPDARNMRKLIANSPKTEASENLSGSLIAETLSNAIGLFGVPDGCKIAFILRYSI
jgi:hypothetical protein